MSARVPRLALCHIQAMLVSELFDRWWLPSDLVQNSQLGANISFLVFGTVVIWVRVHVQVESTIAEQITAFSDTESCVGICSDVSRQSTLTFGHFVAPWRIWDSCCGKFGPTQIISPPHNSRPFSIQVSTHPHPRSVLPGDNILKPGDRQ